MSLSGFDEPGLSRKKPLVSIFFYKCLENMPNHYQYILFNEPNANCIQPLMGEIEEADNFSHCLTASKLLLQSLSIDLDVDFIIGNKFLSSVSQDFFPWQEQLTSATYHNWVTHFSQEYFWRDKEKSHFTYFVKISSCGLSNIRMLKSNSVQLLTQSQLIVQKSSLSLSTQKVVEEINFDDVINQYNNLKNESNQSCYILYRNKPPGYEKFNTKSPCPYINIEGIYLGIFRNPFEIWHVFNSGQQEYPTPEQLKQCRCIVISGSNCAAYDSSQEWIVKFRDWIKATYNKYAHIKFLGICWGEQVIAQSLGGKTEKMIQRQQDPCFMHFGVDVLQLSENIKNYSLFKDWHSLASVHIIEAHGDIVTKVPSFCDILSTSQNGIEIYASKDKRILGFQGHPEFTSEWICKLRTISKQLTQQKEQQEYYFTLLNENNFKKVPDYNIIRETCEQFIKN